MAVTNGNSFMVHQTGRSIKTKYYYPQITQRDPDNHVQDTTINMIPLVSPAPLKAPPRIIQKAMKGSLSMLM